MGWCRKSLDEFVDYASNGERIGRALFVEDAKHGLGFVDVCRQKYDVVFFDAILLSVTLANRREHMSKNEYAQAEGRPLHSLHEPWRRPSS